jgi:hypothetical protein
MGSYQQIQPTDLLASDTQMWLAIAHKRSGQIETAAQISRQLTTHRDATIQNWAQRFLENLNTFPQGASSGVPASPAELLQLGEQHLKAQRYPQAVQVLEQYCQQEQSTDPNYVQAQMWLARAYKGDGQVQSALKLTRQLTTNPDSMVQNWAQQFLAVLVALPEVVLPTQLTSSHPQPSSEPDTERHMPLRSLDELRSFYRKNLLGVLKEYEDKRKVALVTLAVATVILFVILGVLAYLIKHIKFGGDTPFALTVGLAAFALGGMLGGIWFWMAFVDTVMTNYVRGFKSKVIERIIEFIDPDRKIRYVAFNENYLALNDFIHSQLFESRSDPFDLKQDGSSGFMVETVSRDTLCSHHRG